jgi:hypothetical protein
LGGKVAEEGEGANEGRGVWIPWEYVGGYMGLLEEGVP